MKPFKSPKGFPNTANTLKKLGFLRTNFRLLLAWPIAAIILAALGWHLLLTKLDEDKRQIENTEFKEASALSRSYADHLSQTLEAVDQIILHVKYEWELTDGRLQLETIKEKGLFPPTSVFHVGIIDRAGRLVTSTFVDVRDNLSSTSLNDRPYFLVQKHAIKD